MTQEEDVAVAVDVGGTGIKCALVDATGTVRFTMRRDTGRERGPDAVVDTIVATVEELAEKARADGLNPTAVGVVVPGVVNEADGVAQWSANLGLRDVPLRDLVANRVGLPTALGHDVRAGALAEARLGAGRTTRRMLFVAIGTGIAGGYALDGRIDPGAHGASGEIGHITVRTGAEANPCGCGAVGCMEAHASASAIARAYARASRTSTPGATDSNSRTEADTGTDMVETPDQDTNTDTGSDPSGMPAVSAAEVANRVAQGEPLATQVWHDAVAALADGLLTGIALYDPKVIVLGGGLAEAGAVLLEPLGRALEARRTWHRLPELALAELGDEAGCQGAALLALDLAGGER